MRFTSIWCIFFHQLQPRDMMALITRGVSNDYNSPKIGASGADLRKNMTCADSVNRAHMFRTDSAHLGWWEPSYPSAVTGRKICHSSQLGRFLLTSILVCIKEVAVRTTFSHMINTAGTIYYTCTLVIDIHCTRYKNAFKKLFQRIMCQNNSAKIWRKF